jgi:phosphoribosyl 1,2-cyclic phosphodiesterase
MLVRCWGSRGSIPVSGEEYLKYGGDTTCIEILGKRGEFIIIDAGTGIRPLGNRLVTEEHEKIHILLTHPHWDHLSGFPFFKPIYKKDSYIEILGPRTTQDSLRHIISRTMAPPYFPIELEDISANINFLSTGPETFEIGSIQIKTIPLNHTNMGVGYRIEEDGKSFVFLTDNELAHPHPSGLSFNDYIKFSHDADLLYHDAEFTPEDYKHTKGWGHSVYIDAVKLAVEANVKKLGLFHHNQDRSDDGVDMILEASRTLLREESSSIECIAVATGTEIEL